MSSVNFTPIPNATAPGIAGVDPGSTPAGESFSSVLSNAVRNVNEMHDAASTQIGNMVQGGGADLNGVMIAVEKADVAFQLMMQVRNKIVSAYQEIEKMQF